MKKTFDAEHSGNWKGLHSDVNERRLLLLANVVGSLAVCKIKQHKGGDMASKVRICQHGNGTIAKMIYERNR